MTRLRMFGRSEGVPAPEDEACADGFCALPSPAPDRTAVADQEDVEPRHDSSRRPPQQDRPGPAA